MDNDYHAKASMCQFAITSIPFLGYIISTKGVDADPEKLLAIQAWPTPTSFTTLRAFVGLAGYYQRFVNAYVQLAVPLTNLLKNPTFS